jgi:ribonuclease HII
VIDKRGIVYAIKFGMNKCLEKLGAKVGDKIFLDGSLRAPVEFTNQETIIKGDEKVAVISLASICAKVTRDKYMKNLGEKYPEYKFEVHKGYGTKAHYDVINKYGLTEVHRQSFLKGLTKGNKV